MCVVCCPQAGRSWPWGCGTGRASITIAGRLPIGVGVEPDPAMAAIASEHLGRFPGWRVDVTDFERWVPRGECFDLLTCAEAWHWLTPGFREAAAHRALVAGGWLALWWNRTAESHPLRAEFDDVYGRLAPELPRVYAPGRRPRDGSS